MLEDFDYDYVGLCDVCFVLVFGIFCFVERYLDLFHVQKFHKYQVLYNLRWVEIFQGNVGILIF